MVDKNGDVHIANALLRIGGGKSDVDNFSSGGMAAHIDVNSGVIITAAMNGRGEEFVFHPVTGKQIVGYQIPEWERYKEFAISLAKRFPGMRYVGWDIVKTDCDEMCVIEGNKDAGFGAQEGRLLYGLRPIYDRILNAEK